MVELRVYLRALWERDLRLGSRPAAIGQEQIILDKGLIADELAIITA